MQFKENDVNPLVSRLWQPMLIQRTRLRCNLNTVKICGFLSFEILFYTINCIFQYIRRESKESGIKLRQMTEP